MMDGMGTVVDLAEYRARKAAAGAELAQRSLEDALGRSLEGLSTEPPWAGLALPASWAPFIRRILDTGRAGQ